MRSGNERWLVCVFVFESVRGCCWDRFTLVVTFVLLMMMMMLFVVTICAVNLLNWQLQFPPNICPSHVVGNDAAIIKSSSLTSTCETLLLNFTPVVIYFRAQPSGRPWLQRKCPLWWTTSSQPSSTPSKPPRVRKARTRHFDFLTHTLIIWISCFIFLSLRDNSWNKAGKSFNFLSCLSSLCTGINISCVEDNFWWECTPTEQRFIPHWSHSHLKLQDSDYLMCLFDLYHVVARGMQSLGPSILPHKYKNEKAESFCNWKRD